MAALATNGLRTIWQWWYPQQPAGRNDPQELAQLDAVYLIRLLDAAETALEAIPKPRMQPRHRTAARHSVSVPRR
jgi:hypothetical protein